MKNLLFIFITLTTLPSVSYASFPVPNALMINQDTIKKESVEDYHLRLQKMGFDLESCKCEDCKSKDYSSNTNISSGGLFLTGAILFVLSLITFIISILDFVECINRVETCNESGVPYFVSSFVFFWSSIICFIMGFIVRRKRRNNSDV